MKDQLESFFKKNLSDSTPGDDLWNVPSDKVWEEVFPEVRKRKGIFIPWSYLALIGILLSTASGAIWYMASNQDASELANTEISSTKTKSTQEPKNTTSNQPIAPKNIANNEPQEVENQKPERFHSNKKEKQSSSSLISESTPAKSKIVNNKPSTTSLTVVQKDQTNNTPPNEATTTVSISKKIVAEVPTGGKTDAAENPIAQNTESPVVYTAAPDTMGKSLSNNAAQSIPADSTEDYVSGKDLKATTSQLPENKKTPLLLKGKFGIGGYYIPTYSATFSTGNDVPGLISTKNPYAYSSNFGIDFRYYVSNRLAIVAGIERMEIKSQSNAAVDFGYQTATETPMPGGDIMNTSSVSAPSHFGLADASITYVVPDSANLPNGEIMQSTIEFQQSVAYLSIPLSVEYTLVGRNRLNWFAEGGFSYNLALKGSSEMSSQILHHGTNMKVMAQQSNSPMEFSNYFIGFHAGIGVSYHIYRPLYITGAFRYIGNITPLNLTDGNYKATISPSVPVKFNTGMHNFNLKIGLSVVF